MPGQTPTPPVSDLTDLFTRAKNKKAIVSVSYRPDAPNAEQYLVMIDDNTRPSEARFAKTWNEAATAALEALDAPIPDQVIPNVPPPPDQVVTNEPDS